VATATRGDKRLIAVVLGAPSSAARALKAAQLLERGFATNPLAWFLRSETIDALVPVAVDPPNLRDDICGPKRRRAPAEDADEGAASAGGASGDAAGQHTFLLSSFGGAPLRPSSILTSGLAAAIPPVEVYVGPARQPGAVVTNELDPFPPAPAKKKSGTTIIAAKPPPGSPRNPGPAAAKPAAVKTAKPGEKAPSAADAAPAEPLPQAIGVLKPWPGETPAGVKPSSGETPAAVAKTKPAVAAVAKPKPAVAAAPKTEAQ
jgi:D-alanyl-D-alanine carboxypeptidase